MESQHFIHVVCNCQVKSITITESTPDEAMAFAIVLFQKYARIPGDKIVIISLHESTKHIILNSQMKADIQIGGNT